MAAGAGTPKQACQAAVAADSTFATLVVTSWKLKYCKEAGADECWETSLAPSKSGGYVQGSHKGVNKFMTMNKVAAFASPAHGYVEGHEASHLCHNRKCFNPAHVVFEPKSNNLARIKCPGVVMTVSGQRFAACRGVHEGPHCKHGITLTDAMRL